MKNLKLPTLKRSKDGARSKPEAPKFLSDLYRDLSDRHLLLPLVGLLVAIVAVPMLLSSDPAPSVPPAAPPGALADSSALDGAVIVSDPGIRAYRKRLAAVKEKNPFEEEAASGGGGGGGSSSASTGGSGTSTSTTDPSSSGATSSSSSDSSTSSSSSISTGSVSTGGSTTVDTTTDPNDTADDTTDEETEPETRFYTSRIDVTVGPVGDAKTIEGVRRLDFLPNEKKPVVAFLGLASAERAIFSVNPGVLETAGEGACSPKKTCEYLSLKVGQERRLVYGEGEDAQVYRLKLLDTEIVRIPDPREGGDDGQSNKVLR